MKVFSLSAYEKRHKVPEKSRPQFREHDEGLNDVTFSCARSQGPHVDEMISVHSRGGS